MYFEVDGMEQEYFDMDKIRLSMKVNGIWVICMEKYDNIVYLFS
jgi:hypothetical protein